MPLRPFIVAVALGDDVLPAPAELLRFMADHWPEMAAEAEPARRPGVMTFAMDEDTAGVALLPKPLPWEELAGPCAAAWYWPQAAEAFSRHTAHLIATMMAAGRDPLHSALRLTALVAAAAASSAALGIYWGPGRLVHSPEDFFQESLQMGRQNLPLNLWIDFRIQPEDDGTRSLFTTGMTAFGHREVEIWQSRRSPQVLRDCAYNVAHHLLEKGVVLKQGETIGLTDAERIPITLEPSRWDSALTVVRLEV